MKTLPDKPSELIKLALKDLEVVEKDDRYKIDMSTWHKPLEDYKLCSVCFAGVVIANSMKSNVDTNAIPTQFGCDTDDKLQALDLFREGEVSAACGLIGISVEIDDIDVTQYQYDPILFKEEMLSMANKLQELGH